MIIALRTEGFNDKWSSMLEELRIPFFDMRFTTL